MQDIILGAANEIGGAQELARWYRELKANQLCFWRDIAPRVLPKIIEGTQDTAPPLREIQHYLVAPDGTVVDPVFLELNGLAGDDTEH